MVMRWLSDYWPVALGLGYLGVTALSGPTKTKPPGMGDPPVGPGGEEPEPDLPPEPDEPAITPALVIGALTRDDPESGFYYQVKGGGVDAGGLSGLVQRMAEVPVARRAEYMRAIARSRWNWSLYATQATGAPYWSVVVGGVRGGVALTPFLPGNDSVLAAMNAGKLPSRCYAWGVNPNSGAPAAQSCTLHGMKTFGRLWLPPVAVLDSAPTDLGYNADEFEPLALYAALGVDVGDMNVGAVTG